MSAEPTNDRRQSAGSPPVTDRYAARFSANVSRIAGSLPLLALLALALGLRLLVWRWHAPYPLGGDESEYFAQALTLLREHRYVELKLMRPPLYTGFLAACIYLFDSLVQRLRLVQALISALTIVPMYALAREIFDRRVALVAALLTAASYTLAANATELLTETLFLFILTVLFWLLLKAGGRGRRYAALAGLALGALLLLRSVALPLLPLGALWLLLGPGATTDDRRLLTKDEGRRTKDEGRRTKDQEGSRWSVVSGRWPVAASFVVACALVVLPWTARNYVTYGAPILVDTTGPENLWLDNDPAGREAVKRQLYALGDDRAARQRIALSRGAAAIAADPGRFLAKAWQEAQRFFALQYFDDMRDRRAIWVPPLEVWLRLLLGDGLWLALLLGGIAGLWLARPADQRRTTKNSKLVTERSSLSARHSALVTQNAAWLFVPWALYTLLTAVVFHVELRYRLPLYPALIPYAAWAITRVQVTGYRLQGTGDKLAWRRVSAVACAAALTCLLAIGLTLLHRSYIGEAWMLGWKHARLWQAERALSSRDSAGARRAAQAAQAWDGDSALARVTLARAALLDGDRPAALQALDQARAALPAHPYAHLLRGAILREQGQPTAAGPELAYETASLEDLQSWAWDAFAPLGPAPAALDVGGGLDLGYVRGFSSREAGGFRWSGADSSIVLTAPGGAARLDLRLAAGRPAGAPRPSVAILLDGRELRRIMPEDGWRTYSLLLDRPAGPVVLTLRADTFRPRDYDPASPDGRALGVMVGRAAIVKP